MTVAAAAGLLLAGAEVTTAQAVAAPPLPMAEPESVGMSSEALAAIRPAMQELVDDGRAAGVLTMVARHGKIVHWDAHGWRVLGEDPLEPSDVFRIYSMTKPVTSVAAMMLVEDGRLGLDEPLETYIPAFADVQVYVSHEERRPPSRSITIRDLLRHTSGITYGVFGQTPVDSLYRSQGVSVFGEGGTLEETVANIAALPLLSDPGTRWNYSLSVDVLGRVIEVVSGMTLDDFFRTRIFEPLGMEDTGFHVDAANLDRFAAVYAPSEDGLRMIDPPDGRFAEPPAWYAGGAGLTSTAMDYVRFCQMLLNGGELDGVRLLQPETVQQMRTDQLPEGIESINVVPNHGFGLGFATARGDQEGIHFWMGVASTHFWIDSKNELIGFAWTQYQPLGRLPIDPMLRRIVYGAIN